MRLPVVQFPNIVVNNSALFLNKNDQSALDKFLTQAVWDEQRVNHRRIQLGLAWLHRRPVSSRAGGLILDDTLARHTGGIFSCFRLPGRGMVTTKSIASMLSHVYRKTRGIIR